MKHQKLKQSEQLIELININSIDSLGSNGDGIISLEGEDFYVPFALPEEEVTAKKTKIKNKLELVEIIKESPDRIKGFCQYFTRCGGCSMQHLRLEKYQEWKISLLTNALKHKGFFEIKINDLQMIDLKQRRRVSFSYANFRGKIEFGFLQRHSHRIVDVTSCPLLVDSLNHLILPLQKFLSKITKPKDQGHISITDTNLHLDMSFCPKRKIPITEEIISQFTDFAKENKIARITRAGKEILALIEEPKIRNEHSILAFPSAAFLQPSIQGEELLKKEVMNFIKKYAYENCSEDNSLKAEKPLKILDLFAGLGAFSVALTRFGEVVAIDSFGKSIIALAEANIPNLTVKEQDLFINPLSKDELENFEVILLDPPRCGASEQIQAIAESKIKLVIYVSCNPGSFARDAKLLREAGYLLQEITPIDQFPYVDHLELVAVFKNSLS